MGELSQDDEESLRRMRTEADKAKLPPPSRRSRRAKKFADFPLGLDDRGQPFEPPPKRDKP